MGQETLKDRTTQCTQNPGFLFFIFVRELPSIIMRF